MGHPGSPGRVPEPPRSRHRQEHPEHEHTGSAQPFPQVWIDGQCVSRQTHICSTDKMHCSGQIASLQRMEERHHGTGHRSGMQLSISLCVSDAPWQSHPPTPRGGQSPTGSAALVPVQPKEMHRLYARSHPQTLLILFTWHLGDRCLLLRCRKPPEGEASGQRRCLYFSPAAG